MRVIFDRVLRHSRYRDRRILREHPRWKRFAIAGWVLCAVLLLVPAGYTGWKFYRWQRTSSSVERCGATCAEHGDEFFLDEKVVAAEIARLGGGEAASRLLVSYVKDSRSWRLQRWVAIDMLGYCGRDAAWAVPQLAAILFTGREDALERSAAAFALGRIGTPEAIATLKFAARNQNPRVREYAIKVLARTKAPGVEDALLVATNDTLDWVRLVAVRALGRVGSPQSLPTLVELNQYDLNVEVRAAAYEAHEEIVRRQHATKPQA